MRLAPPEHVEDGRILKGPYGSPRTWGCTGCFRVGPLLVMASDASDWPKRELGPQPWEHVSVSRADRCPGWEEMAQVKSWFWDPEELVIQFHPPKSKYVNVHPRCLHLWRPVGLEIPLPPLKAIGSVAEEWSKR